MTSTTTSTSGSSTTPSASSVSTPAASSTSRSLARLRTATRVDLERARRCAPRSASALLVRSGATSARADVAAAEHADPHRSSIGRRIGRASLARARTAPTLRCTSRRRRSSSVSRRTTTRACAVAHEHHRRAGHLVVVRPHRVAVGAGDRGGEQVADGEVAGQRARRARARRPTRSACRRSCTDERPAARRRARAGTPRSRVP